MLYPPAKDAIIVEGDWQAGYADSKGTFEEREVQGGIRVMVEVKRVTLPWWVLVRDNAKYTARVMAKKGKRVPVLILSTEYRKAKEAAQKLALRQLCASMPFKRPVQMTARFYEPNRSRQRDILNFAKMLCDALKGLAYEDDAQIDRAEWVRARVDAANPRVEVLVEEVR